MIVATMMAEAGKLAAVGDGDSDGDGEGVAFHSGVDSCVLYYGDTFHAYYTNMDGGATRAMYCTVVREP